MLVKSIRLGLTALAVSIFTSGLATAGSPGDDGTGSQLELKIGGFVVVSPKYEGAKDYKIGGFPFLAPAGLGEADGRVQFRGLDDIRVRVVQSRGFEFGPLVGWRFGREEDDGRRLAGLGDIDGGLVAGAYAAYRLGSFLPFVSYHHQVTGDSTGGLVRLGVEAKSSLPAGVTLRTTVGASYGDDSYMDTFFGVTPGQSAASIAGLRAFDTDAGVKDAFLNVSGDIPLSAAWALKLNARYARLIGDAADSPITESENQLSGSIGVTYKFGLGR